MYRDSGVSSGVAGSGCVGESGSGQFVLGMGKGFEFGQSSASSFQ